MNAKELAVLEKLNQELERKVRDMKALEAIWQAQQAALRDAPKKRYPVKLKKKSNHPEDKQFTKYLETLQDLRGE